jgi:ribosomal protein S18 acetylase RimI-like enzyme
MKRILIRSIVIADIKMLLPLVRMYWSFEKISDFEDEPVSKQLTYLFSNPHLGMGWMALAEEVPVGYFLAVYVFSLEHLGLTAEIDEFFILPQYRKKGIGKKLLENAETEFIRIGCRNVSLQIDKQNDAARAFYHKQNYFERSRFQILEKMS